MPQNIWCDAHEKWYGRPEAWQHAKCKQRRIRDAANAAVGRSPDGVPPDRGLDEAAPPEPVRPSDKPKFDRNAYQRELMRKRRARGR